MAWTVTTPPAGEPIDLADAKDHLRVDGDEDDSYISALITAARQHVEVGCHLAIMPQEWSLILPAFPAGYLPLSGGPYRAIDSVEYINPQGDTQALTDYQVVLAPPARIAPNGSWPVVANRLDAVTVRAQTGYENVAAVPAPIKQAILLLVGHWYENREASVIGTTVAELPMAVESLLFPYRTFL